MIRFAAYDVRVEEDCGGGATVACRVNVYQEHEVLPGLIAHRLVDGLYGAGGATAEKIAEDRVRIRCSYTRIGPQEDVDELRPFTGIANW